MKTKFGPLSVHVTDFTVLAVLQFVLACVGLFTRVKVANALGREGFGEFVTASSLGSVAAIVCQFGMEKSLIGEYVRHPGQQGCVLASSLRVKATLFLFSLLGIAFYWRSIGDGKFPETCAVVSFGFALRAFSLQALYDARHLVKLHAILFASERCIYFLAIWAFFLCNPESMSLHIVAALLMLSSVVGLALQYGYAYDFIKGCGARGTVTALSLIRTNLWTWLAGLCALMIDVATPVVLASTSGPSEVGKFSAGFLIAQGGCLIIAQIGRLGNKLLADDLCRAKEQGGATRFLIQYTAVIVCAGVLVGIALSLASQLLISQFTHDFGDSLTVIKILSWYPLAYGICHVFTQYLILSRQQTSYFACILLCGLGSALVLLPACVKYASRGAAMSLLCNTAITGCVLAAISFGSSHRNLRRARLVVVAEKINRLLS